MPAKRSNASECPKTTARPEGRFRELSPPRRHFRAGGTAGSLMSAVLALMLIGCNAAAQDLSGSYSYSGPNGVVTLTLQQEAPNRVTGTMQGAGGLSFRLEGHVENGRATGSISTGEGSGFFAAGFEGSTLLLVVAEVDPVTRQPDLNQGWRLDFVRTGGAPVGAAPGGGALGPGAGSMLGQAPAAAPQQAPPAAAGITSDSPLAQEWLNRLRGRKVTYIESYSSGGGSGGYSEHWEAYLCSDMTFVYQRLGSVSVDVGASAHRSSQTTIRGSWRIVTQGNQAAVEYRTTEGEQGHFMLAAQGNNTIWDGKRVFVTNDNNVCR